MLRLPLKCVHGHHFDGWFHDRKSFDTQIGKLQVTCPECTEPSVAEVPPIPPGLYAALNEDEARHLASETRHMLQRWMVASGRPVAAPAIKPVSGPGIAPGAAVHGKPAPAAPGFAAEPELPALRAAARIPGFDS